MSKHETKNCPRCNEIFECKVNNIFNCLCYDENISQKTRTFLSRANIGCNCTSCLRYYDDLLKDKEMLLFPTKSDAFIEGLHYYLEDRNWVFTEIYHLLRGHCCESGCRHCPYGYKK